MLLEKSPPKQNPGKTPASQPKESSRPTIQPKMRWSTFPKISITTQQTAKKESFKSTKSRSTILVTRATQPSSVKHCTTSQRTTTRNPSMKMRQSSREATTKRYPQKKTESSLKTSKSGMLDQAKVSITTKTGNAVITDGLKMSVDTNHISALNDMGRLQATGIVSGMCKYINEIIMNFIDNRSKGGAQWNPPPHIRPCCWATIEIWPQEHV